MRPFQYSILILLSTQIIALADDTSSYVVLENLIDSLEFDKAEDLIKKMDSGDEKFIYLSGKLNFYLGRYREAYNEFSKLSSQDYVAKCAINSHELTKNYISSESEHFKILYPSGRDEVFIDYLLEGLEEGFKRFKHIFGFVFKDKIRIEILRSQKELSDLTTLPVEAIEKTNTIAVTKFNKIMMLSPETQLEGYDYVNTAIHELIHFFISTVTSERTPVWIHESLARYFDHYREDKHPGLRPDTLALLKYRQKNRTLVKFEQIHPSMALLPTQEDTEIAFAEVFLVSEFLIKREGIQFVKKLMDMLKRDMEVDEIFRRFGFSNFSGFENEFFKYLEKRIEKAGTVEHLFYERVQKKGKKSEYLGDVGAMKYVKIGDLLFLEKLYNAAFVEYDKASKYGTLNPHIENRKAFTLLQIGRASDASSILEQIVDLYPDYLTTFINLARAYISQKDYSKALSALDRAVRINPFDKEIYLMYIKIFSEQGNQFELDKMKKKLNILK